MSTSIDQQFVEFVVKSLVSNPEAVIVDRRIDEKGVLLELTVDPEDLGRVIGKRGATAQSLRTLLRALGTKNDARYNLKIIDNGAPQDDSVTSDDSAASRPDQGEHTDQSDHETVTSSSVAASSAALHDELGLDNEAKPHDEHNDRLTRTRRELADLDDLDV